MGPSRHKARAAVKAFLHDLGAPSREVAEGEWGLVLDDVGGRPLEVGLRLSGELLTAQAWVAPAGVADPHLLLHRNRLEPLARLAHSSSGDVHVHGDAFASGLGAAELDRLLGAVVEAAAWVRASAG